MRVPEIEYGGKVENLSNSTKPPLVIPLGFSYLASVIKERTDYEVHAVDIFAETYDDLGKLDQRLEKEMLELIKKSLFYHIESFKPSIIGFSALYIFQHKLLKDLCRMVRKEYPNIIIFAGGYTTIASEMVMRDIPSCDVVFIGEAENSIVNAIRELDAGKSLQNVTGLAFRDGNNIRVNNKSLDLIMDIDKIPLPAFDVLPLNRYKRLIGRNEFPFLTSRSCPFGCNFCSSFLYSGRKHRIRSLNSLLNEMKILKLKYEADFVWIRDENFNVNKNHAKNFLKGLIDNDLVISWCDSNAFNADSMDEEFLDLCKATSCEEVIIAVESGSPRVLKEVMNKKVNLEHVKKMAAYCRKLDMPVTAYFVVGNPGETKEEVMQTVSFAMEMDVEHSVFSIATPFPGTQYNKVAIDKGYLPDKPEYVLGLKYMESVMDTEHFTAKWLKGTQYDANINLNFLENRKTLSNDKKIIERGLRRYSGTYKQYKFHAIARLLEGYLNMKLGRLEESDKIFRHVGKMLEDPDISKIYSKYFKLKTLATDAYRIWCDKHKQDSK